MALLEHVRKGKRPLPPRLVLYDSSSSDYSTTGLPGRG